MLSNVGKEAKRSVTAPFQSKMASRTNKNNK